MRCYRVDEDALEGIPLTASPTGPWHIEVGNESVELDERFSATLSEAKSTAIGVLEEALLTKQHEGTRLDEDELGEVADILTDVIPEGVTLLAADLKDGKVIKERRHHPDALVLVETAPGINGRITFKGTSFEEKIDGSAHRVRRRYSTEFPPPGIQVLKEGKAPGGSRCLLLRMMPSSSFRIERSGELEGAPGVLTVVWKGQKGAGGAGPLEVRGRGRPD